MSTRRLRKVLRDPLWLVLVAAAVVGIVVGTLLADEDRLDVGWLFFGRAWRSDTAGTRSVLVGLFGYQITVLTIVLSLNASMIQSAANQYSPRLVPLYLKSAPLRRALPLFVLSGSYVLAAVRELGLIADHGERPRAVVSGAFLLIFVAVVVLGIELLRTARFLRVEGVLGLVREAILLAHQRLRRRFAHLSLDSAASLSLPSDATALAASASGYLTDIDLRELVSRVRTANVRARIDRAVGDYMDEGEVIGWVAADGGGAVDPRVGSAITRTLVVTPARELDLDPVLGMRILVDVANRALSSSTNDPYTAKQALQQLRSVLRELARRPLGDCNVIEEDGQVRLSLMGTPLREYLRLAVDGPLRYSGGEPDVLEAVLEVALEVGRASHTPEDCAAVRELVDRVIEDATKRCDRGSLRTLCAEADALRADLPEIFRPHHV
jgi:uncharacterized membrane protein